ncbi:MAG: 3-dehydroquinate synthase [Trueperaceae bacterium]|nr:3-dehydroquinate synthase [Trueperaceae bacterium]
MSVTVDVRVDPPYPVRIGVGVAADVARYVPGDAAILEDANVASPHGDAVATALRADGRRVVRLAVAPGEASKSVATWEALLRRLAQVPLDRSATVVAVGGGVTGDLAGFVAASYLRGVAWVNVPTSLLAMADAAIGGKTGLDLPEGKNLVGAFWQPRAVLMDVGALATLPEAAFTEGLVEVAKHGLLADPALLAAVLDGAFGPDATPDAWAAWVAASVRVKADVVARDAHETGGARATLNLGHTVGHALEAASGHALTHGEAVAWGLLYAAHLSHLHLAPSAADDWRDAARRLVRRVAPAPPPDVAWPDLAAYLLRDKKNREGAVRWVLAERPGAARLVGDVPVATQEAAWRAFAADVATLRDDGGAAPRTERNGAS